MREYLMDPVFRIPLLCSLLMCLSSSLVGVLIFLKKRSLLSETLSHTTYPGVTLGLLVTSFFSIKDVSTFLILSTATIAAIFGFFALQFLQKRGVKEDAALTFVLASFFGFGVTLSSIVQSFFPEHFRNVNVYLYGNVATISDNYLYFYALFSLFVIGILCLFFKEFKLFLFDKDFAITMKVPLVNFERLFMFLVVIAVVVGMRSVGLILVSAMLIAPAIFARAFTDNLKWLFVIAGGMSVCATFLGNILSLKFSTHDVSIPDGPTIVLITTCFSFSALLFAPKRGLMFRFVRSLCFQFETLKENLLKALWRSLSKKYTFSELIHLVHSSRVLVFLALFRLRAEKSIEKEGNFYKLNPNGLKQGAKIIRLHRLWEVYLVDYLGIHAERVHKSAEEIEHILNHDLEKALIELLDDPVSDPHNQPIPKTEVISLV